MCTPSYKTEQAAQPSALELFVRQAEQMAANGGVLPKLAEELGVSIEALRSLRVGALPKRSTWPEKDASGRVIGIMYRCEDGSKRLRKGGRRGLYFEAAFLKRPGPILVVEGGSDTAAGITLGLPVVGRPSNTGGRKLLIELLASVPGDRQIIVTGEWDEQLNGVWPGKDGAIQTARALANSLRRPVSWALPPDGAKDVRAWLQLKRD